MKALSVLHADFTGTATNIFQLNPVDGRQLLSELIISIADQGSNADGVYKLQHLDYSTPASPAWVNLGVASITAVAGDAVCKVYDKLPPGLYRLNTASETGTVDIFGYADGLVTAGLVDPTA